VRLLAVGLNYRTAPVPVRERAAQNAEHLTALLASWRSRVDPLEAVTVSTCNRLELYLALPAADEEVAEGVVEDVAEALGLFRDDARSLYLFDGEDAARHLFRVTSSLDSQVLGEDQIQGQVKESYQKAVEGEETGPVLNHLFHQALRTGKRVRTETEISRNPVSVATAGVALARRVFGDLSSCRVLVIGAGEMARLALGHLHDRGVRDLCIVNRTLSRAVGLTEEYGGRALPPMLTREDVEGAVRGRVDPLLLVDLSLPRNLDPALDTLEGVLLYDLDALEQVTDESRIERRKAAVQGEHLTRQAAQEFAAWMAARKAVPVIKELLRVSQEVAVAELARVLKGQADMDPELRKACEQAVVQAVKKVLHRPLVSLRGFKDDEDDRRTLEVVRGLFDLKEASG
jgi:glutamyl-tRNA reductase